MKEEEEVVGEEGRAALGGRKVKVESIPGAEKEGTGKSAKRIGTLEVEGRKEAGGAGGVRKEGEEGDDGAAILAMAILLVRHAMQDTFGKGAVTAVPVKKAAGAAEAAGKKCSSDKPPPSAEINIDTDGAVARLRVFVVPPPRAASTGDGGSGVDGPAAVKAAGDAAWRCEVVECAKSSLRSQITLLIERLRVAVSKS